MGVPRLCDLDLDLMIDQDHSSDLDLISDLDQSVILIFKQ